VIGGIALAFINPLAAILPFLDPGTGDQSPCGEALRAFNGGKNKGARKSASGSSGGRAGQGEPVENEAADEADGNQPAGSRGIPGHGAE
jgi:hypothetical protein